jgi:hypothetical protein
MRTETVSKRDAEALPPKSKKFGLAFCNLQLLLFSNTWLECQSLRCYNFSE